MSEWKTMTQAVLDDMAADDWGCERELVEEVRHWRALVERLVAELYDGRFCRSCVLTVDENGNWLHEHGCVVAEARRRLEESK